MVLYMLETVTAADLLKTTGILTVTPDTPLGQALSKLRSSHDAVFVAEDKNLLGLISPYHVLYKSHFPPETKVRHCLFSPPKISLDTPLPEIAAHMIESKVYFLPVVNKTWEGIVTKNRILELLAQTQLPGAFNRLRRPKPMITIGDNASVGRARNLMKQSGISRLLVIDPEGDLQGIITRFDLRLAFIGHPEPIPSLSIRPYIKPSVITSPQKSSPETLINLLIKHNVGSVVLVKNTDKPIGIVTTKDILQILTELVPATGVDIDLTIDEGFTAKPLLLQVLQKSLDKLRRHDDITDVSLKLRLHHNQAKQISRYEITLSCHHHKKGSVVAKTEHPEWKVALHEALDKLEHQISHRHYG